MRTPPRTWFVVLTLAAALPATATTAADKPSPAADTVYLMYREPKSVTDPACPPPFLGRELMRQAFLIAARDECGLRTPDATLGDKIPESLPSAAAAFDLYCTVGRTPKGFDVRYTLSRTHGKATEKLGEWSFITDVFSPHMVTNLADLAERMSRGKFKNLLNEQKLAKPVPAAREFAGVPRETTERLWEWNEISLLGALRRIHSEIRTKGESPELVAGLAVGYANLGSVTDTYFSPMHKAFFARALLYAERLVHESDASESALWHRAYVRALAGLHNAARVDVKAARKAWDKKTSRRPPFWADILEAFCDGQLPKMMEVAKNHQEQTLARYLKMLAVVHSDYVTVTIQTCTELLQDSPECLRAATALCATREIDPMRRITDSDFSRLSESLRRRLPDVYGLPTSLAKRVSDAKPAEVMAGEKALEDAVEFRLQLVDDLKAETTSGRDTLEPSLDVLGKLIEELQFEQVIWRLDLEHNVWGVPTEATLSAYRPLVAHHPFAAFLGSFTNDRAEQQKTYIAFVAKVQPADLVMYDWFMLNWIRSGSLEPGTTWLRISWSHADPVWNDEMMGLDQGIAGEPDERHTNKPHMDMMWDTSSRLPAAVAVQVYRNWYRARAFMGTVENDYGDDPILMGALASRFRKLKQWDNAERCAKKRIAKAPDYGAYRVLAAIYQEKGDLVHWKETLLKSLDLPSHGLEQASVQNEVAEYHMNRKEWKEAVVFADAAAVSYSAWSMLTASRCHEMLGQWTKAEAFMRAVAERYDGEQFEWMKWCYRTGHGDAEAADNCARTKFESLGTNLPQRIRQQVAVYYMLRKEPEKAQTVFEMCFNEDHQAFNGLHAALIADQLGKTADRDGLLAKIVAPNPPPSSRGPSYAAIYRELVGLLQKAFPPGSVKDLDFKKIDALIGKSPDIEAPTNLEYFVGVFLKNRGDKEKSREYLIRAAQSDLTNKYNHIFARQVLRDLKIPVPEKVVVQSSSSKK